MGAKDYRKSNNSIKYVAFFYIQITKIRQIETATHCQITEQNGAKLPKSLVVSY